MAALVDAVLDKAGQKGTGQWTAQSASSWRAHPEHRGGARRARAVEHEGRPRGAGKILRGPATKPLESGYRRHSSTRSTMRSTPRRSSPTPRASS